MKQWHVSAFNSVTFIGWATYQLIKGPDPTALILDVVIACWFAGLAIWCLKRDKKREELS